MPGLKTEDLEQIFQYHKPTEDQQKSYQRVRDCAKAFAEVILNEVPSSPDQTVAIRKVREAVMTSNAAIALHGEILNPLYGIPEAIMDVPGPEDDWRQPRENPSREGPTVKDLMDTAVEIAIAAHQSDEDLGF